MQFFVNSLPICFWSLLVWSISKGFQFLLNQEKTIWEVIWERSLIYFNNDEYNLFVNGSVITTAVATSWLFIMFTLFDFTQKPAFIRKYKVNPHTNEPPDYKNILKILAITSFNGLFITKPTFALMFYGLKWRGIPDIQTLPSFQTVLISCLISDHIFEVVNYFAHRILHHRLLYKHMHKMHHEFKPTFAIVATYVHPIEHLILIVIPFGSAFIMMRCHIATAWIYMLRSIINSALVHSGYHLPFMTSSEFHDFHHFKCDTNYGALGFMDRIFGTDIAYKNSICEERDKPLLSFKSMRELYPNMDEKVTKSQ